MSMLLAVFVSFGFICAISHAFRYRRGCPMMNPLCPCPTYENGCFVCKCMSGSNSNASNLFGGGFQPGVLPGSNVTSLGGSSGGGSNVTSSGGSSGGVCPPDPRNCLPWLVTQDSNGCRICGSTGLMSHNNGNCPPIDPSCPPMLIYTDASACLKCDSNRGTHTTFLTTSTITTQTTPTTPVNYETTTSTERSSQTTLESQTKPTFLKMFPTITSKQTTMTATSTISNCPPYPTDCTGSMFCETNAFACLECKCARGCQPFPHDCPKEAGCAEFRDWCPVCTCTQSVNGTVIHLSTGCQTLNCPLNCGKPPRYKKDYNCCDICECQA